VAIDPAELPRFEVVFCLGQCDKKYQGWCEGSPADRPAKDSFCPTEPSPSGKVSLRTKKEYRFALPAASPSLTTLAGLNALFGRVDSLGLLSSVHDGQICGVYASPTEDASKQRSTSPCSAENGSPITAYPQTGLPWRPEGCIRLIARTKFPGSFMSALNKQSQASCENQCRRPNQIQVDPGLPQEPQP
jgi:hypothetical protein